MAKVLNNSTERIQLGSLVITNKARFYISVSLGEFFFEGDVFMPFPRKVRWLKNDGNEIR
jgi:hypothetical protein